MNIFISIIFTPKTVPPDSGITRLSVCQYTYIIHTYYLSWSYKVLSRFTGPTMEQYWFSWKYHFYSQIGPSKIKLLQYLPIGYLAWRESSKCFESPTKLLNSDNQWYILLLKEPHTFYWFKLGPQKMIKKSKKSPCSLLISL